ncbi:uncharacterized protein [Rutidosis leptorrhynchoides]|uniref:uncharacterized protein n=1 Tax=Rutidosis leptorrhynchoides TaxID=125765 RepID=UPI003A9A6171
MFKKLAPKDMQHKFERPDVIQQMIEKYCAENKEARLKKATEIMFAIYKFVENISDYPITTPPIVPATLGVYSGLTDLLDFLQRFEGVGSTYNWDEPVVCRVFPMVLQGLACEWFQNLSARSIVRFIDLREKFLLQFQNLLPQKKTHVECHEIKQGFKETLGSLLTRYIYECQKIPNLNEDQKIYGFVHAINPQKHPTLNCSWGKDRSWRDENDTYRDGNGEGYRDYKRGSGQQRRNNNGEIGTMIDSAIMGMVPIKVIITLTRNTREIGIMILLPSSKHYQKCQKRYFYKNVLLRCHDLFELIADAVGQGKLNHLLLSKETSTTYAIAIPALASTPKTPNVNTVVQQERKAPAVRNLGANVVGKKDSLQEIQKPFEGYEKWQLEPITFTSIKDCGLSEEPIVISCKIAGTGIQVMKVHVDTGSSVDVMYNQCFRKLPKDIQSKLKSIAMSLSGFSGESAWPIGQLELEIEIMDEQNAMLVRKAFLNLYVMNTVSCYNILLGCTAVCKLGIISSTIHGMVKFATSNGIAKVTSAVSEPLCASIMVDENIGTEGHVVVASADVMMIE